MTLDFALVLKLCLVLFMETLELCPPQATCRCTTNGRVQQRETTCFTPGPPSRGMGGKHRAHSGGRRSEHIGQVQKLNSTP